MKRLVRPAFLILLVGLLMSAACTSSVTVVDPALVTSTSVPTPADPATGGAEAATTASGLPPTFTPEPTDISGIGANGGGVVPGGGGSVSNGTPTTNDLITSVFQSFQRAVLNAAGAGALEHVDAETLAWFNLRIQAAGQPGPLPEDLMARLIMLRLRHEYSESQLQDLTPASAFITAVNLGWFDYSDIADFDPYRILNSKGEPYIPFPGSTTAAFAFVQEGNVWKVNMLPLIASTSAGLQQEAARQGLAPNDLLLFIIQNSSNHPVNPEILNRPLPG